MCSRDFGKAGRFKCVPRMFWYDLTRVATKCARLYLDRNILRYSLGLPPWHAGHVEITGEKNGRGTVVEASTDLSSFS